MVYVYTQHPDLKKTVFGDFKEIFSTEILTFIGDLQQLLIRGGFTYIPKESPLKLTLGYAYIGNGTPGDSDDQTTENRFYQETSFPLKLGKGIYSNHRFRYEMRFVEDQDFRTRYRYALFLNIPLNKPLIEPKTLYIAFYNEVFINGQRIIGNGNLFPFSTATDFMVHWVMLLEKGSKCSLE